MGKPYLACTFYCRASKGMKGHLERVTSIRRSLFSTVVSTIRKYLECSGNGAERRTQIAGSNNRSSGSHRVENSIGVKAEVEFRGRVQ